MHPVVWLVEKSADLRVKNFGMLAGEFAVRIFRSLEAAEEALLSHEFPHVLVINSRNFDIASLQAKFTSKISIIDLHDAGHDLLMRVQSIFGRQKSLIQAGDMRSYGSLCINMKSLSVTLDECAESMPVSPIEARILCTLIEAQGECVPRTELCRNVWSGAKVAPKTLNSHISRLRRRLEPYRIRIEGVYGIGYAIR